jgi:hypothetical protein
MGYKSQLDFFAANRFLSRREKARMPRSEELVPTLKGGDEWPCDFEDR